MRNCSQNSRASVKNDPQGNNHEIVVSTGSAEVQRGDQKIELTQWQKASFPTGGPIQKIRRAGAAISD